MAAGFIGVVIVLVVLALLGALSLRIVQQYERGVVFRFGRVVLPVREPGLRLIIPIVDRMVRVSMQTTVIDVPAQGAITRDNVTLKVDAVVYFRVVDPVKALVNVEKYPAAVLQISQTALRSVIGKVDLDTLLADRDKVNADLKSVIDDPTEGPWGLNIERVEVKDVSLPEGMKRSMSRQAEAERDRRARVIAADGEYQASRRLADASQTMANTPGAYQLRLLQTVSDVAAEKNSTLVMPFPVELLRFFDKYARGAPTDQEEAEQAAALAGDGHRRDGGPRPAR
ncbi:slipin family protein [Salinispora pacifica]|uniref:slipin family protein n=1 Tax=Salinispora pacifica TaxID=351187 RepID=UPI0003726EB5|nr:slipin family protein [Salinispora pacifica]